MLGSPSEAHANQKPIANTTVSVAGNSTQQNTRNITVQKGSVPNITINGSASSDPDGWTTSTNDLGVSGLGKCQIGLPFNGAPSRTGAMSKTIDSPANPAECSWNIDVPFDQSPGVYQFVLLRITDSAGAISDINSNNILNVTVVDAPVNAPPVPGSRVRINNGPLTNHFSVRQGETVTMFIDGSLSTDPDGWNTPGKGVSNGGRCVLYGGWYSNTPVTRTVENPASPSACTLGPFQTTFTAAPGHYVQGALQIFDASGAQNYFSLNDNLDFTITDANPNQAPIAVVKLAAPVPGNGTSNITVTRGVPVKIAGLGSSSSDPDGWADVSNGGRCEWNTDLNRGVPTYELSIPNPALPGGGSCDYSFGTITFNDAPGTYVYSLLRITDKKGAQSVGTATITVAGSTIANTAPVAVAKIRTAGEALFSSEVTVTQGVLTHIYLGADASTDANGWTTPSTGVSQGGKCDWNTDLNRINLTFERTIVSPATPASCNIDLGGLTFNDAPGRYTYPVLRITDASGGVSSIATVSVVVVAPGINMPPVAVARFSLNGAAPQSNIVVSRGVPVRIGLDASASFDPNGWKTSLLGVSGGGKCEWNTNLDQSRPTPFIKIISNPAAPGSCNADLGTLTFNDTPGTYTYVLLRITDAGGLKSLISGLDTRSRFALSRFIPTAFAQGTDGSATITVIDGPDPSIGPSPSETPDPTPSCDPYGYNAHCPTPTPFVDIDFITPTPSPTSSILPTIDPSTTPDPCPPGSPDCGGIIPTIIEVIDEVFKGIKDAAEPFVRAVTNIIAALLGVDPAVVAKFIQEKGGALATALAGIGAALSAPLIVTNIVPQFIQWGRLLGFFGTRKRKDRWGIVVDSDLGTPIARAVVQVFDAAFNQLKETQITGADGQFGFLLPPGKYYIVANVAGFTFPARKKPPVMLQDNERIYLGEEFTMSDKNPEDIPHVVVPMDRDVKVSAARAIVARYVEIFLAVVDRVGFVFLLVGGGVNTYLLFANPGLFNVLFEALYLVLFAVKLYILAFHKREVGNVVDSVTKQELDLAIVRLYDSKTNRIVQTRVTNKNGKFFLLLPKGMYNAAVSKQGYETLTMGNLNVTGGASQAVSMDFALKPQV